MSPSPTSNHQRVSGNIYYLLRKYLDHRPIGEVYNAPLDVFLSEINIYQPDIAFIARERASFIAEQGIEGAPNLVIEILSPSTAHLDKGPKRKIYARTGVEELWIVDPVTRFIQVYRLADDPEVPTASYNANAIFKSPLLPGLRIRAADIFKGIRAE